MLLPAGLAEHPCQVEVESACPDRPGPEMAACLKDPSEHEKPTTISSECTDFIALNVACSDTILRHCEEAFFSRDTVLCLTQWIDPENVAPKCSGVMDWAIPKKADADGAGPTDELGLSEKDYAEKKAWQAKRKSERNAAIERMKETDKQKEEDRQEMERLKKEDPEGYERMLKEKEQIKSQNEEQKKRERLHAAALERKRKAEAIENGEEVEEEVEEAAPRKRKRYVAAQNKQNWLPYVLGGLAVAFVFFNVLNWFTKGKEDKEE